MEKYETPHYMYEYWQRVKEDAERQLRVAEGNLAKIALRMEIEHEAQDQTNSKTSR